MGEWPVSPSVCAAVEAHRKEVVGGKDSAQQKPQKQEQPAQQPVEEQRQSDGGDGRPGSSQDGLSQGVAAEEDEEEPEIHGRAGEGEEGRLPRMLRAPHRVTKEEREAHEITHTPYRAWCRHCVRARGRNSPHTCRSEEMKRQGVPKISLDYFFMSSRDEAANENPILVMVDENTGEKYARAVGQKGVGRDGEMDWLIKDMAEELKSWGHTGGEGGHIILKSDGERAISAVREALAKFHGGKVVPEAPPRGESQSNGVVEEAGKTVREYVRVLKEQVEYHTDIQLDCAESLTAWMIRWAAMLCSRYAVGQDGLTAYERRRGRKCRVPVVIFGEKVWYKELRLGKERRDKFESEWQEGIWLGHSRSCNEHVVGTKEGVVRAYSVKRQDEDQRWSGVWIKAMRGTPQQPDPSKPGLAIPVRVNFDPPAVAEAIPAAPEPNHRQIRRMKITNRMLEKYGYSQGCEGCRYKQAGLGETRNHSEVCRARILEAMDNDEDGRRKKEEEEERINRRLAEHLEKADERDRESLQASKSDSAAANAHDEPSCSEAMECEYGKVEEEPKLHGGDSKDKSAQDSARTGAGRRHRSRSRSPSRRQAAEEVPVPDSPIAEETTGVKRDATPEEEQFPKRLRMDDDDSMKDVETQDMLSAISDVADFSKGWNFTMDEQRRAALKHITEKSPKLIIGSNRCAMGESRVKGAWRESCRHTQFVTQLYRAQIAKGLWYLHEQPTTSTRAGKDEVMAGLQGVSAFRVPAQDCAFDSRVQNQSGALRARLDYLTNSGEIKEALQGRSVFGRGLEIPKAAAGVHHSIQSGLAAETQLQRGSLRRMVRVDASTHISTNPTQEEEDDAQWQMAWGDVTGQELDPSEVAKARSKEMSYVEAKKVWTLIPRKKAHQNGWKIIPTRWIDINKGDQQNPNYRSRLVAKEFNNGAQEGLFAATPPLEALRLLISDAATSDKHKGTEKVIMVNDVARAFFEAPVKRTVCVELPPEALSEANPDQNMVGLLQMSLYGTRDAAANFQDEVRRFMSGAGFQQSLYNPQVYWHKGRGLKTLLHGDDFITTGTRQQARWFRKMLEARFDIKTAVIGDGLDEVCEDRVLGRIIRVTSNGWEYEADQRHAELIVRGLGLEKAKSVNSPGEDEKPWEVEDNAELLQGSDVSTYRALAARANYLAQDRADIQFAAKEICRGMAQPTKGHLKRLRRLGRYLVGASRVVWHFAYQGVVSEFCAYSDSDWAGCKRTARSTSGGAILRGSHCIRTWAVTQRFVTLSTAEAELMALVRAATEAVGASQLGESWGLSHAATVLVDSSAALAVTARKGNGKLRHVRIAHLWVQEAAEREEVLFRKVRGSENPADLLTKYLSAGRMQELCRLLGQHVTEGSASTRLALNSVSGGTGYRPSGTVSPLGRGGVLDSALA